jgi:hypothetical protein
MANFNCFSGVLRISDVTMTEASLEAALKMKLDRFEPARSGSLNYAQLSVPIEGGWTKIVDWIQTIGPQLSLLRDKGLVGPASIDLAIPFYAHLASTSIEVPSYAAESAGRHGIDLEITVCLTNEDRGNE